MEVVVGGGEKLYSKNLRDFLKMEEDNQRNLNQNTASSSGASRRSSSGLTLSAILNEKIGQFPPADEPPRRVESNGTLLDIIRDDQTSSLSRGNGRRSWQHLTDKIRLRRRGGGSAWPVAVPTSSSDFNNNNRQRMVTAIATGHHSIRFNSNTESGGSTQPDSRAPVPHRNPRRSPENESGRFEPMSSSSSLRSRLITDENHQHENGNGECPSHSVETEAEGGGSPEQPMRMSLMSLLAENDRQMGFETSAYVMDEVEAGEDVEEGSGTSSATGGGVEYNNCCVCMLRHKGAAFIPCGHTFCRLCSRELWVQRGNCPLCNNFILEILDIF